MLQFAILGSGSSGNSALACFGETRVLIDAGLSARQLELRLRSLGIEPDDINAIVLTHEHGDHSGGLDVFCRKREIPVFGTRDTCTVVGEGMKSRVAWRKFEAGQSFEVGSLVFESFSVPHDAVDPVGFVVRGADSDIRVGVLSDVGQVTTLIRDRLQNVDTLFVEANYDESLLQNDTKRPWATKQRISSRHGHLSNDQAAELIVSVASDRLHRVLLGHLSRDCNQPDVATRVISGQLAKAGFPEVIVECANPKIPLPLRAAAKPIPTAFESAVLNESPVVTYGTHRQRMPRQQPTRKSGSELAGSGWRQSEWTF
ncbi:MAG: MBL fold metallo-hydrolase [Verrucomicrobiae bacterium]|nr:MBL fold metallo-hydrolase [Verrucomicrobiae bacterium]